MTESVTLSDKSRHFLETTEHGSSRKRGISCGHFLGTVGTRSALWLGTMTEQQAKAETISKVAIIRESARVGYIGLSAELLLASVLRLAQSGQWFAARRRVNEVLEVAGITLVPQNRLAS